jgi:hypothetical protein
VNGKSRLAYGRACRNCVLVILKWLVGRDAGCSGGYAKGEAVSFGDAAAEVGELFKCSP